MSLLGRLAGADGSRPPEVVGYRDLTLVAAAGRGASYRARRAEGGTEVVLKLFDVGLRGDHARRRFLDECAPPGQLAGHPGVAPVLDAGFGADDRPYVVRPSFRHGSLADALRASGPLEAGDAVRIGIGMAEVLDAVHRAGGLHRNITPANVLLAGDGRPVLADFGIPVVDEHRPATAVVGGPPPYYTAPEVLERTAHGVTSDVYSLAATVYALLAGHPPFADPVRPDGSTGNDGATVPSAASLLLRMLQGEAHPLARPDVPAALQAALLAALASDPARRTASAAAFALALAAAGSSAPSTGRPATPPPTAPAGRPATPPADDLLEDHWPGSAPTMGPPAGSATSRVWQPAAPVADPASAPPAPNQPPAAIVLAPAPPAPAPTVSWEMEPPAPPPAAPTPPRRVAPERPPPPLPSGRPPRRSPVPGLIVGALVAVGLVAAAVLLRPDGDDQAPEQPGTTSTAPTAPTAPTAALPAPTGLAARESAAGVQLSWEGDPGAAYVVLVLSEDAAPMTMPAEDGPHLLVPVTDLTPDVGYCFAVAHVGAVAAAGEGDIAGAFSTPVCVRGASQDTVRTA